MIQMNNIFIITCPRHFIGVVSLNLKASAYKYLHRNLNGCQTLSPNNKKLLSSISINEI